MTQFLKKLNLKQYLSIVMIILLAILDANHVFIGMWNNVISFFLLAYVCFGFSKKNAY